MLMVCAGVAALLAGGAIVGWFQGRLGFGSRALGFGHSRDVMPCGGMAQKSSGATLAASRRIACARGAVFSQS